MTQLLPPFNYQQKYLFEQKCTCYQFKQTVYYWTPKNQNPIFTLGWYKLRVFVFEVSLTIGQLLPTFFPNQSTTVEKIQEGGGGVWFIDKKILLNL